MAEVTGLSPVRNYIVSLLNELLPDARTYWSNDQYDRSKFYDLTGVDQSYLNNEWDVKGTRFTTCTSFLPRFATRVRRAGKMAEKVTNKYGVTNEIKLGGFTLNREVGWVDYLYDPPQPGDFYMLGHDNWADHVGVVVEVDGDTWATVAGGAGGRSQGKDGVSRSGLVPIPDTLMGWLDVDVYFAGWREPKG